MVEDESSPVALSLLLDGIAPRDRRSRVFSQASLLPDRSGIGVGYVRRMSANTYTVAACGSRILVFSALVSVSNSLKHPLIR